MATRVRETAAGKSISAYVVLNKKGEHVATVNAHYSNGGTVTVDVWNLGTYTVERCLAAASKSGAVTPAQLDKAEAASRAKRDWARPEEHSSFAAYDLFGLQQGTAGGYGYDKFAAAIRGLWIDGVQMTDHCGHDAQSEKMLKSYIKQAVKRVEEGKQNGFHAEWQKDWDKKAAKIGASFANYNSDRHAYQSLHISAGLKRLEAMGYRVISAI